MSWAGAHKRRYLAVYDYGTGGVWLFIHARSREEITSKYPELRIMDERAHEGDLYPPSSSDVEKQRLDQKMTYDIDEPPRDVLLAIVNDR